MIDAEEAEALARAAAEKDEAGAREEALAASAQRQARREAAEQSRLRAERDRLRAEGLLAVAATAKPKAASSEAEETIQLSAAAVTNVVPRAVEEPARGNGRPNPGEPARVHKARLKADKRAAKQAARQIATLEKKEARERKALAKAAARRKTAHS
jgi:hypothetical protein